MSSGGRLFVVQTHPIQYFSPLFASLVQHGCTLSVLYTRSGGGFDVGFQREVSWDVPLLDGYEHGFLPAGEWKKRMRHFSRFLECIPGDAVLLFGYSNPWNWLARWRARKRGARLLYFADSNARIASSRVRGIFKFLPLRWFFSGVDCFLVVGEANAAYLRGYRVSESKMRWCPFGLDTARFRPDKRGRNDRPYDFIWAGKFTTRKRPCDFIAALQELRSFGRDFKAIIVGDGPLRQEVQHQAANLVAEGCLAVHGFANQSAMPDLLKSANTFVLSSESEPFGLIASEAMAAGCALVVEETAGCVDSRGPAKIGSNAYTFKGRDVRGLAGILLRLLESPLMVTEMKSASLQLAPIHDVRCMSQAVLEAAFKTTDIRRNSVQESR